MAVPAYADLPLQWEDVLHVIAQSAESTDLQGVPRSHFEALSAVGAHGSPTEVRTWRELTERLAAADASTWFCWAQHQTPLRTLEAGGNQPASAKIQERWLAGLRSGHYLAAVAFAHIRRPGPANPVARRVNETWELDGTLDWVTSWDIADVVMIMALTEDTSEIVTFFIPSAGFVSEVTGVQVGAPLRLLSMSGTHTRPITFTQAGISNRYVFDISPFPAWQSADARKTLAPNAAALGVARGAINELESIAQARHSVELQELTDVLTNRFLRLRDQAYAVIDLGDSATDSELIESRVAILEFARECAAAVVIARAGAGMQSGRSAERRVRESMFLQVQAQTATTRNAALGSVAKRFSA